MRNVWTHYCKEKKEKWSTWLDFCPACGEKKPHYGQIKEELAPKIKDIEYEFYVVNMEEL